MVTRGRQILPYKRARFVKWISFIHHNTTGELFSPNVSTDAKLALNLHHGTITRSESICLPSRAKTPPSTQVRRTFPTNGKCTINNKGDKVGGGWYPVYIKRTTFYPRRRHRWYLRTSSCAIALVAMATKLCKKYKWVTQRCTSTWFRKFCGGVSSQW